MPVAQGADIRATSSDCQMTRRAWRRSLASLVMVLVAGQMAHAQGLPPGLDAAPALSPSPAAEQELAKHTSPQADLWQRLGGVQGIQKLSWMALNRASTDPRTRRSFDGVNVKTVAQSLGNMICVLANGPCQYEGETMARAHAGLNLQGSEFEALVTILREEMDRAGVSQGAKNELLRCLAPMRRDVQEH